MSYLDRAPAQKPAPKGNGKGGTSQTRQLAQMIAKLRVTSPKKAAEYDHLLETIPEKDLKAAGLERPKHKSPALWKQALGTVGKVLEPLDRPSQAVLGVLQDNSQSRFSEMPGDVLSALGGHGGDRKTGHVNARQAFGIDKDAGGLAGDIGDFAGTLVTDPLTYLTLGTGSLAKGASKGIEEAALSVSDDVARKLAEGGVKALSKAERTAVREALEAEMASTSRSTMFRSAESRAAKGARKQINEQLIRGKGGVNLHIPLTGKGVNVISAEELSRLPGAALVRAGKKEIATSSLAQWFKPRALLSAHGGNDLARDVYHALETGDAAVNTKVQDTVNHLNRLLQDSDVTDEELNGLLKQAIEKGEVTQVANDLRSAGRHSTADLVETMDELLSPGSLPGIGHPTALAEGNAAQATVKAVRETASVEARRSTVQALSKMDYNGNPLVYIESHGGGLSPVGLAKLKAGELEELPSIAGAKVYAPKEIAPDLNRTLDIMHNDQALKRAGKFFDDVQHVFKTTATLPITAGAGFFSRNAQSNVLLNFLAGYSNPGLYTKAIQMRSAVGRLAKEGAEVTVENLQRVSKLTEREAQLVVEARKRGVLTTGFFDTEVKGLGHSLAKPSVKQRAINQFKVWEPDGSFPLRKGAEVNEYIENSSRMAHFLGAVDRLGNLDEAALSVKKYLFDYGDLTAFERQYMRRLMGFYTFARKNAGLMLDQLGSNTARVVGVERIQDTLLNDGSDDPLHGGLAAPWATEGGQAPLRGGLANILTGGGPAVGRLDDPVSSAVDTLMPIIKAAQMAPGVPGDASGEEVASGLVNQLGGGAMEALKLAMEEATDKDLFTGAPLKHDGWANIKRLVSVVAPVYSKQSRLQEAMTQLLRGEDTEGAARLRVINAFLGLSATPAGDQATLSAQTSYKFEIQDALADLKKHGVKVPTVDDLREAGIMPDTKKPRRSGASGATYGGSSSSSRKPGGGYLNR